MYGNPGNKDGSRNGKEKESKALVTVDGESLDWTTHCQDMKNMLSLLTTHRIKHTGYGDYRYSGNLSYENEVFQSVFKTNKSDFENPPLHKRLDKTCEMQAVPQPMTGNYLPSGPDIEIDDSQYTYGPEKTQPSESKKDNPQRTSIRIKELLIEDVPGTRQEQGLPLLTFMTLNVAPVALEIEKAIYW
ncbi:hypothetical protein Tco_0185704 [Tanacetum coccineum]